MRETWFNIFNCTSGISCVCVPDYIAMSFSLYPIILTCAVVIPQFLIEFNFYKNNNFDLALDSGYPIIGFNNFSNNGMTIGKKKFTVLLGLLAAGIGHLLYVAVAVYFVYKI